MKNRKTKMNVKYMELITHCPLLPITGKKAHDLARKMIIELSQREGVLSAMEIGYGKVLAQLIEIYEQQIVGDFFKDVSGEEVLEYLLNEHELKQSEAAAIAGISKQNLNDYLNKRRALPGEARMRLAAHFKVSPEVFESTKALKAA
jgi:antitoxin component HigA of HigAB toxin-antitoxin module